MAWLAGLVDGEGTIGVYISQGWVKKEMRIVNTNEANILEANRIISALVGHSASIETDKRPPKKAKHIYYAVGVYRQKDFVTVLESLLPYLIAKKAQAEVMLHLCKNHKFRTRYTSVELQVIDVLKKMKKEGMTPVLGNTEGSRLLLEKVDPVETVNSSNLVAAPRQRNSDSENIMSQNITRYNTLGKRITNTLEGIVHSSSNGELDKDRSSRLCRKLILRPSPEMAMKNPANSVKSKSGNGYGNAELADPETGRASVEALHGAPFGVKTKPDSHRKVSQIE